METVAPHAGAWIETRDKSEGVWCKPVAPHAGAWIETAKVPQRILWVK